jgi:thiopurine S-methyltransferase
MHPDYWKARWQEGRIGFHEGRPNRFLEQHVAQLGDARRVLVPLCGKAEDMAWLATHGHEVVGVDVAHAALRAFFDEHHLAYDESEHSEHLQLSSGPYTLVAGDFFSIDRSLVGAVDAFYDRAALVALPAELRPEYVRTLRSVLPASARGLVVSFEYPQDQMPGPPFSVGEAEIRALYGTAHVELLAEAPVDFGPRLKSPALERAFLVTL